MSPQHANEAELLAEAQQRAKKLLAQLREQQSQLSSAKALGTDEKARARQLIERALHAATNVLREVDSSGATRHVSQENDEQQRREESPSGK